MYAGAIIGGVTVLILGSLVKRMMELRALPLLLWPVLLVAGASPAMVAYDVLHPRPVVDAEGNILATQLASAEGDELTFEVPEAGEYSVMVTAHLREYDPDEPAGEKTSYALGIRGKGWKQSEDDVIRRDTAGSGPDVALTEGEGISQSGTRRGTFGEDLQDRFELRGSGLTIIDITNWDPAGEKKGAAEALEFQIFHAPPSREILWGLAGFMTLICFGLEIRCGCERVSHDVAFLMVWAVALRDGVTPLDDWQQIGSAMLPALLVGFLGVAGISYVLMKYVKFRPPATEDGENGESDDQ
jgi:hypothetical protein